MTRRENQTQTKKVSRTWTNWLGVILLVVGIALFLQHPIKNFLVHRNMKQVAITNVASADIDRNKSSQASFDFDAVKDVDINAVLRSSLNTDNLPVIGGIAMPSVKLNLPILNGIANDNLIAGAGTMKPDMQMGEGNYSLAGHHMIRKDLLFSPLFNSKEGDLIYLTDLTDVYIYRSTGRELVAADRLDVIEDRPGKAELTLVTCDDDGSNRYIFTADFVKKIPLDQAGKEVVEAFSLKANSK